MRCNYDSSYDIALERYLKNDLNRTISLLDNPEKLKIWQDALLLKCNKLYNAAETIDEKHLESILGNLYLNLMILMNVMLKTKSYKKEALIEFLGFVDKVRYYMEDYSSSERSEELLKIATKL